MKRESLYCLAIGALVAAVAIMDARQRRLLRQYAYDRQKLREVALELQSVRAENRRLANEAWKRHSESAVDFRLMADDVESV